MGITSTVQVRWEGDGKEIAVRSSNAWRGEGVNRGITVVLLYISLAARLHCSLVGFAMLNVRRLMEHEEVMSCKFKY